MARRNTSVTQIDGISGFRGCGKSALGKVVHTAFNNWPRIRLVDMSDAIRHFLGRGHTSIGAKLKDYVPIMNDGGIVTDGELIFEAALGYVEHLDFTQHKKTTHLILTGAFRTRLELDCYRDLGILLDFHEIQGTYDDMLIGVARRESTGELRTDSVSLAKLQRGWNDYIQYSLPAWETIPSERHHRIKFGWDLRKKATTCISKLRLPSGLRSRLQRRIETGNHPACQLIKKIEAITPREDSPILRAARLDQISPDKTSFREPSSIGGKLHLGSPAFATA